MKWDGLIFEEIVKDSLYKVITDEEREKASTADNNKEYADFLKKRHTFSGHCSDGIDITAQTRGITITFFQNDKNADIINALGDDKTIELTWSMAARHIRAWAMENKVTTQYSVVWDGTQHYEAIKTALMEMLTETDKKCAVGMSTKDFCSILEEHYGTYDGYRGAEQSEIRYINRNPNKIAFCIPEKGSNPPVEYEICVPWELAAVHIVSWVKEEKPKSETERKWETTHLCGDIYKETEDKKMLPTFDFSTFNSQDNQLKMIPIDMLDYNNDYERYDGEQFTDMVESIKKNGILQPLIVQAKPDGRYYILAGNNRRYCGEAAGVQMFPCIVKENLSDEEAQAYIDETNVYQRGFTSLKITKQAEVIARRHSQMFDEKKLKAIQREIALMNGEEVPDEEQQSGEKTSKLAQVGQEYGLSKDSIARLIRVNKLVPELKPCVDDGRIAVRTAVNLSYLFVSEQRKVAEMITDDGYTVDMKKSALLKEISEKHQLNDMMIEAIIKGQYNPEAKPPKPKQFKIRTETAQKYFQPDWEDDKIQEVIEAALEMYFNYDVAEHIESNSDNKFDDNILNMKLSEKSLSALRNEKIFSFDELQNALEYKEKEFQEAVGLMVYDEVLRKLPTDDE